MGRWYIFPQLAFMGRHHVLCFKLYSCQNLVLENLIRLQSAHPPSFAHPPVSLLASYFIETGARLANPFTFVAHRKGGSGNC